MACYSPELHSFLFIALTFLILPQLIFSISIAFVSYSPLSAPNFYLILFIYCLFFKSIILSFLSS